MKGGLPRLALGNRVKSAVLILVFLGVWLSAGGLLGYFVSGSSGAWPGAIALGIIGLTASAYGYFRGGAAVLRISGAEPADPVAFAQLHRAVDRLASRAGLPKPYVFVMKDPAPNAFATGRDARHAALTVTTGLLDVMSDDELDGVVAHELSHIKHRDILLLLIVSTVVGTALLLAGWAWQIAARNPEREDGQRGVIALTVLGAILYAIGLLIGPIIQLAVSRSREYLADAGGAELAGDPTGLISALTKLEGSSRAPAGFNHATAGMFIDNPLEHYQHWLNGLFDTHPPIELRIADLQRAAGLPVTAIALHRRIEQDLRAQDAQERLSSSSSDSDGLVQIASIIFTLVVTPIIIIFHLWLWYVLTVAVFLVSGLLGAWLSTKVLRLSTVGQLCFGGLVVGVALGAEAAVYLTGLWVWVLAALIAFLVGTFVIFFLGHETAAFLRRRER
ncbi:MAG: heat shock protein HtpX [Chloroflexota bacterium]|jgi:heat shock protein HtpX|nr:heat shock protein HtpX [Chloroflexota bacterium]